MTTTKNSEKAVIDRILQIQEKRGTTDIHLFNAARMSRFTWKRSIHGERSFTLRELIAISDVLGVRLTDLTGDDSRNQAA